MFDCLTANSATNCHSTTQSVGRSGVNLVQNVGGDVLCRGSGGQKSPVGSRGEAPVGDLGDEVPRS